MYRIMQMLCMWFFIPIIIFHFIPISIMPHPIKHMWSSTVITPPAPLPYLLTHSPAPALTFLTHPHRIHISISLTQGEQHPLLHPLHPWGHLCPHSHCTPAFAPHPLSPHWHPSHPHPLHHPRSCPHHLHLQHPCRSHLRL